MVIEVGYNPGYGWRKLGNRFNDSHEARSHQTRPHGVLVDNDDRTAPLAAERITGSGQLHQLARRDQLDPGQVKPAGRASKRILFLQQRIEGH